MTVSGGERFGPLVFIPGAKGGRYPFCNSLYIDGRFKGIIDPGAGREALSGLSGLAHIDFLINTHYHEDHFAFNHLFPDALLCVHESDAPCFESMDALLDAYGMYDADTRLLWRDFLVQGFNYVERKPDRVLRDGDLVDFGDTVMEVIHTPGHTPGHISCYFKNEEVLFSGDIDLTPFGPWYGDAVSSIGQTISSVKRLLDVPAKTWITPHDMGIVRQDVRELAERYLRVIDEREERIANFLSRPRTLDEIASKWFIYGRPREPEMFYAFGERGMVARHLEYLLQKGDIIHDGGIYRLA